MTAITPVHLRRHLLPFGLLMVLVVGPLRAQQQGTLRIVDWPASEAELAQVVGDETGPWSRIEVLPFLDSLVLGYRYEVVGDTVYAGFTLAWRPATWGLYRGHRVLWDQMPDSVQLQAMHVRIRFAAGGRPVTTWPLRFDSLALDRGPRCSNRPPTRFRSRKSSARFPATRSPPGCRPVWRPTACRSNGSPFRWRKTDASRPGRSCGRVRVRLSST
ncbi:hypothetical protein [Rhodothermus marinus]|uniref:hypothetical protein n=1 Tax=Rhodothermus marinus TaxID=29549 RepID=UPI000AB0E94D|nr:hypothetical protein [Rhodothermus marinus]